MTKSEALEASITHWEENLAAKTLKEVSVGADACALCSLYNKNGGCTGCPVKEKTGHNFCWGTPYIGVGAAMSCWQATDDDTLFRDVAQKEIDFLKSLR